jgi:hypothetical protein
LSASRAAAWRSRRRPGCKWRDADSLCRSTAQKRGLTPQDSIRECENCAKMMVELPAPRWPAATHHVRRWRVAAGQRCDEIEIAPAA